MFPFIQTLLGAGAFHHWHAQSQAISPGDHECTRVRRDIELHNPPDDIDTSKKAKAQEEAILWLSQMPIDPPNSKALVSSLALISSSPCDGFQKSVVVLANSVLEVSFRGEAGQEQTDTAIDCILMLGNIKFQSVVNGNSDCDHNIGGIPVPPSIA